MIAFFFRAENLLATSPDLGAAGSVLLLVVPVGGMLLRLRSLFSTGPTCGVVDGACVLDTLATLRQSPVPGGCAS
jgi:hypothetical protein